MLIGLRISWTGADSWLFNGNSEIDRLPKVFYASTNSGSEHQIEKKSNSIIKLSRLPSESEVLMLVFSNVE